MSPAALRRSRPAPRCISPNRSFRMCSPTRRGHWSNAAPSACRTGRPMADEAFVAGFMDDYFIECEEHLATIRRLLLALESDTGRQSATPKVLEELFRSFHSIKGISGMVELREAEMLAHQMESYLRALRQRDVVLSQRGVDALIAGVQALEVTIAARRDGRPAPPIDRALHELAAITPSAVPAIAPPAAAPSSAA